MKILKKITSIKFNEKLLCFIMLGFLALALIPVYRLALYSCAYYDDYNYSRYAKSFLEVYGPKGVLSGVLFTIREMWYAWQGTYSSTFFMSLAPVFVDDKYYFLGIWAVITVLTLACMILTVTVLKNIFKANTYQALTVAVVVTLFFEEFIYTSYQGIFWYNSAAHYTLMHSLMMLMVASSIKLLYLDKAASTICFAILAVVFAVAAAGANFVTALQGILFLAVIIFFGLIFKNKRTFYLLPALLSYGFGLYKNVVAPGNSVRGAHFEGMGAVSAVIASFKYAFIYLPKVTRLSSIIVLLVIIPSVVKVVKKSGINFRYPGIITAFSFCFYATGFTPSLFAQGEVPISRTMVAVQFTYQMLLVFTVIWWCGWIVGKKDIVAEKLNYNLIYYALAAILLVACFGFSGDKAGGYLSYGSYYYVHTGDAYNFRNEYLNRVNLIKTSEEEIVKVPPINFRPWLLIGSSELSEEVDRSQNNAMANYYGKKGVYVDKNYYQGN